MDWSSFKKYTSPQAIKDFDSFLDALPINVGYNALIAAGVACLLGGGAIFFAALQTEKVSKLHNELLEIQALQPPIPTLKYIPVSGTLIKEQADKIVKTYKGISVSAGKDGEAQITATDTDYFPQFLAAISYLQRGGKNWRVNINSFCVGRDCTGSKLTVNMRIETVRIGEPEAKKGDDAKDDK